LVLSKAISLVVVRLRRCIRLWLHRTQVCGARSLTSFQKACAMYAIPLVTAALMFATIGLLHIRMPTPRLRRRQTPAPSLKRLPTTSEPCTSVPEGSTDGSCSTYGDSEGGDSADDTGGEDLADTNRLYMEGLRALHQDDDYGGDGVANDGVDDGVDNGVNSDGEDEGDDHAFTQAPRRRSVISPATATTTIPGSGDASSASATATAASSGTDVDAGDGQADGTSEPDAPCAAPAPVSGASSVCPSAPGLAALAPAVNDGTPEEFAVMSQAGRRGSAAAVAVADAARQCVSAHDPAVSSTTVGRLLSKNAVGEGGYSGFSRLPALLPSLNGNSAKRRYKVAPEAYMTTDSPHPEAGGENTPSACTDTSESMRSAAASPHWPTVTPQGHVAEPVTGFQYTSNHSSHTMLSQGSGRLKQLLGQGPATVFQGGRRSSQTKVVVPGLKLPTASATTGKELPVQAVAAQRAKSVPAGRPPSRRKSLLPRTMLATARAAGTRARLLAAGTRVSLFAYSSLVSTTLKLLR
jgi:hypothetical protein